MDACVGGQGDLPLELSSDAQKPYVDDGPRLAPQGKGDEWPGKRADMQAVETVVAAAAGVLAQREKPRAVALAVQAGDGIEEAR